PAAPLRGPGSHHLLHVLDGLAVPLIIEGREVVHRGVPLVEDVCVTAPARLGAHEELGGYQLAVHGLRGAGKEGTGWTVAFAIHGVGRSRRIMDAIRILPALAQRVAAERQCHSTQKHQRGTRYHTNNCALAVATRYPH